FQAAQPVALLTDFPPTVKSCAALGPSHPTVIRRNQTCDFARGKTCMTDIALPGSIEPARRWGPDLDRGFNPILSGILFGGVLAAAFLYVAYSISPALDATGARIPPYLPFTLFFFALLIALGFEFFNGFHDPENAVATVIYPRSLPANIAVA